MLVFCFKINFVLLSNSGWIILIGMTARIHPNWNSWIWWVVFVIYKQLNFYCKSLWEIRFSHVKYV